MVQFGKKLENSRYEEWGEYYLDYEALKRILRSGSESPGGMDLRLPEQSNGGNHENDEFLENGNSILVKDRDPSEYSFRIQLDREIEKVVLFFLDKQGQLASKLAELRTQHSNFNQSSSDETLSVVTSKEKLQALDDEYQEIGLELLRLVQFVELNVTAVRKILKKHDKKKAKEKKLSKHYLLDYFDQGRDCHLNQLYHYGGISALVTTLKTAFDDVRLMQRYQSALATGSFSAQPSHHRKRSGTYDEVPEHRLNVQRHSYLRMQSEQLAMLKTSSGRNLDRISLLQAGRHGDIEISSKALFEEENFDIDEPIIFRINMARQHLTKSREYVDTLAAQAHFFLEDDTSHGDSFREDQDPKRARELMEKTKRQKISSFLNLVSTFLYMTNYYIVAPTSGLYAESLGSSPALAGIIIGMTPIAALVASFLYGWWSNYSYKSALLFAAGCSLLGDILYALALPYNSLSMVIAGRYLNGFGSARAINRRYIADVFSRRDRTAQSAAFVTAGALGMAVGPAIAALLGKIEYSDNYWTVETGPGYVMFALWSSFFVATIFLFEEPERNFDVMKSNKLAKSSKLEMVNSSHGEKKPLLRNNTYTSDKPEPLPSLWTNVPVMVTLVIYFVLKLVLECLLSSTATLSAFYFDWDMTQSGAYLAMLGLLMFPANLVVASLSLRYEDRELMMGTLVMMLVGCTGFLYYGLGSYSVIQYVFFGVCIFLSTNALEGPNMALLSKTIPKEWAKGTFNSGLLATEAGTAGRAVGDLFISAIAYQGFEYLLNGTFVPLGICVLLTTIITWKFFAKLEPADDDSD